MGAGTSLVHHEQQGLFERLYTAFLFKCIAMKEEDGWRNVVYLAAEAREKLQSGGFYFPVGRLVSWPWYHVSHLLQRVGMLQAPIRMETSHETLWTDAEEAIELLGR